MFALAFRFPRYNPSKKLKCNHTQAQVLVPLWYEWQPGRIKINPQQSAVCTVSLYINDSSMCSVYIVVLPKNIFRNHVYLSTITRVLSLYKDSIQVHVLAVGVFTDINMQDCSGHSY